MSLIAKFIHSKRKVPKERRIAFGFVLLALTICSAFISYSLPESERWLGFICFFVSAVLLGGFRWLFVFNTEPVNSSSIIRKKSVGIEFFHYVITFTIMIFNTWFGIAAYSGGYSKLGSALMIISIIFLCFKQWKSRYLYLVLCFSVGIIFIELNI